MHLLVQYLQRFVNDFKGTKFILRDTEKEV